MNPILREDDKTSEEIELQEWMQGWVLRFPLFKPLELINSAFNL